MRQKSRVSIIIVALAFPLLLTACPVKPPEIAGTLRLNVPKTVSLSRSNPRITIKGEEIDKSGNVVGVVPITLSVANGSNFNVLGEDILAKDFPSNTVVKVQAASKNDNQKIITAEFNVIAVDTTENTIIDNSTSTKVIQTSQKGGIELTTIQTPTPMQVGQYYASATEHVVGKVMAVSNGVATVEEVPISEVFKSLDIKPIVKIITDDTLGTGQSLRAQSVTSLVNCKYDNGSSSNLKLSGLDVSAEWISQPHGIGRGIKFELIGDKYIDVGLAAKLKITTQLPSFTYDTSGFASAHCTAQARFPGLSAEIDIPYLFKTTVGGLYDFTFDAKADASGHLMVDAGKFDTTVGTGFILTTINTPLPNDTNVFQNIYSQGPLEAKAKATVTLNPDIKFSLAAQGGDARLDFSTTQIAFPTSVNFQTLPRLLQNSPSVIVTHDLIVKANGRAYSPMLATLAQEFNRAAKWTPFHTSFDESGTLQDFGETVAFATPKVEISSTCDSLDVTLINQSDIAFKGGWIKEVQLFATDVNPVNGLLGLKLVKTLPGGAGKYTFKLSELAIPKGKIELYPVIITTYGGSIPLTSRVISTDRGTCPSNVNVKINSSDLVINEGDSVSLSAAVTGSSDTRVKWSDREILWDLPGLSPNKFIVPQEVTPLPVPPNTFSPSDTANPVTLINQTPGEYTVYAYSLADSRKFATIKLKVNPWVNLKFSPINGSNYIITDPVKVIAGKPFNLTVRLGNLGPKTFNGTIELWFAGDCSLAMRPQTPGSCAGNMKPAATLDWGNVAPGFSNDLTFKGVITSPDTPVPYIVAKDLSGKTNNIYLPAGNKINITY